MILITGATGTIGRELVKVLARPEEPVRVLVRSRAKATSIAIPGVEIVEGDLDDTSTLNPALDGIRKIFLLTPSTQNQFEVEKNFIQAADRSGLQQLVMLSALGADPDSSCRFLRSHGESERFLKQTDVPYTILRPNSFMQNFLGFRESIIHDGVIAAPMGDGKISFVDVRDIVRVAAEVLDENGHVNKEYDITGGQALSYTETAEIFSFHLDRPVKYVDTTPEETRDMLLAHGLPEWTADGLLELYAICKFSSHTEIADTVQVIGRKDPITFFEFVRDYAPQFGRTGRDRMSEIVEDVNLDNMTPGA